MATRDYGSVFSIKDFILNQVTPKYFDTTEVNLLNLGMIGLTSDVMATMSEDTFNAFSTYTKEIFPNLAQIPETTYNNAARFRMENLFSSPAVAPIMLFVNEKEILTLGTARGSYTEFILDSNMVIDIGGIPFMMDYDVEIRMKPYRGDYSFSVKYLMDYENSLSSSTNPFIKYKRILVQGQKYIAIMIDARQVSTFEQEETVINNDKINYPTLTFKYNDQLANFEVFYRAPGATEFTQLTKRLANSGPVTGRPFCYYRFKDEGIIEISFNVLDNYFQPEFNSDIRFRVSTSLGSAGNFSTYEGVDIAVRSKSEKYDYNNKMVVFAQTRNESSGGVDALTLEEIRTQVIELGSTVGSYTTEVDLQTYFANNKNIGNIDILFLKRRDDALERLFTGFSILRDRFGDIYSTNTLNLRISEEEFDNHFMQTNRYVLKPGHLFTYAQNSSDQVRVIPGKTVTSNLNTVAGDFVYTSPFMMSVSKTQGVVGFYLNTVNSRISVEYTDTNDESPVQFICNNMTIARNALIGEQTYTLTLLLTPASGDDLGIVNQDGTFTNNMVIKGFVQDGEGTETSYIDFNLTTYDKTNDIYTFKAEITTDDYMTLEERMRALSIKNVSTGEVEDKLIPMVDCVINFAVFYKSPAVTRVPHKYDYLEDLDQYTLTNIYSTSDTKLDFIKPINIMRSRLKYVQTGNDDYQIEIAQLPFVRAHTMQNTTLASDFIDSLYKQYTHLGNVLDKITINFGVDMKFYNTYGKSKNFLIGENSDILNRVNCTFRFNVSLGVGTVEADIISDLKQYIKTYVEDINKTQGYNSIYISTLFQSIHNTFADQINFIRFKGINGYDPVIQSIENRGVDVKLLTNEEIRVYVPEYLTVGLNDIIIDIVTK